MARNEFLLTSFKAAREELLVRIAQRNNWLKLQLFVQAALLALAQGVEFGGVKFSQPLPDVLILSTAISTVFVCLYYAEEQLIGFIANFTASLTEREATLNNSNDRIESWDHSSQMRQYFRETLPLRYIAVITVFVVIPLVLTIIRLSKVLVWKLAPIGELIYHGILIVLIIVVIIHGHKARRQRLGDEVPSTTGA